MKHDLVFYENRSTPLVVTRGGKAPTNPEYGKQVRRRAATDAEERIIARGDWVRVDQAGRKPSDAGYRTSKMRPMLGKS